MSTNRPSRSDTQTQSESSTDPLRGLADRTPGTVRIVDRRPQSEPEPTPQPVPPSEPEADDSDELNLTLVVIAAILGGLASSASTLLALMFLGIIGGI